METKTVASATIVALLTTSFQVSLSSKSNGRPRNKTGWKSEGEGIVSHTPYGVASLEDGRPISFVAEGKHANYHAPPHRINLDVWEDGGHKLRPDNFGWLLVGRPTGERLRLFNVRVYRRVYMNNSRRPTLVYVTNYIAVAAIATSMAIVVTLRILLRRWR